MVEVLPLELLPDVLSLCQDTLNRALQGLTQLFAVFMLGSLLA